MDLGGAWRAVEADRRAAAGSSPTRISTTAAGPSVPVPGHWRSTPEFADADGPLLYRRRFEAGRRAVAAGAAVAGCSSTGSSTRATSGSTGPTSATPRATSSPTPSRSPTRCGRAPEHVLAVEVACAPPADLAAKRNLTGVFQHWDCLDPDWNPGGIWRPVRLDRQRAGAHRPPAGAAAPRPTAGAGGRSTSGPCLDAARGTVTVTVVTHAQRAGGPPVAEWRSERAPRRRRQPGRTGGCRSSAPSCGGRARSATSRCTTSTSRWRSTARPATGRAVRTGLRQVADAQLRRHRSTASGCS